VYKRSINRREVRSRFIVRDIVSLIRSGSSMLRGFLNLLNKDKTAYKTIVSDSNKLKKVT
jgi:hypothetical protein